MFCFISLLLDGPIGNAKGTEPSKFFLPGYFSQISEGFAADPALERDPGLEKVAIRLIEPSPRDGNT